MTNAITNSIITTKDNTNTELSNRVAVLASNLENLLTFNAQLPSINGYDQVVLNDARIELSNLVGDWSELNDDSLWALSTLIETGLIFWNGRSFQFSSEIVVKYR